MAHVQRSDTGRLGDPLPHHKAPDYRSGAGGHIAQLQGELAQRLAGPDVGREAIPASPGERVIRFLSVAGGYAALLAGYGLAAWAITVRM